MAGNYVDGYVFTVPKKNFAAYKKMCKEGSRAWIKFGALAYYECMGDDLKIKPYASMKNRSFVEMAKAKKTDQVWFSFIVYKNKAHRNSVNKKVMAYFGKKYAKMKNFEMPHDPNKMAYGGFKAIVRK